MSKSSGPQDTSAFKKVFGQEKNKDILLGFLNDMLEHPDFGYLLEATYLDNEASNAVAIRCTDQYKRCYLIEVYFLKDPEHKRDPSSDEVYSRLLKGHKQVQKMRYISITILAYTLFQAQEEVRTDYTAETTKSKDNFIKDFNAVIIELPKFEKRVWELTSKLDYWYYYLKYGIEKKSETYSALIERHPMMKRAYEALDRQ